MESLLTEEMAVHAIVAVDARPVLIVHGHIAITGSSSHFNQQP